MENTPFYKSKRFYINILAVVVCIVPATKGFIEQYLAESAGAWAVINLVLGAISKGKISIT